MKEYLFTYGTLRKGFAPPEIAETVAKLDYIGEGFIYGSLQNVGEYTSIIFGGKEKVFGHIFGLPNEAEVLQNLDEYEGYNPQNPAESFYLRKESIAFFNEEEINCWIYQNNPNF